MSQMINRCCAAALPLFFFPAVLAETLHMHNGGDPSSLDPHQVSGDWENRIVGDLFEGLMTESQEAEPVYGVAERHTVSKDGLVYTFYLRDDALWSDGKPVTAHDFVYAFRRIMDPLSAAKYAWLQYPIKNAEAINKGEIADLEMLGVRVLGDKVLEISLERPTPYFLDALTHYTAYPVPEHAVKEHGDKWVKPENIVSNGPYRAVEWMPGSHVRAVRNERYTKSIGNIDEVYYYVLEDESSALRRYEAGEFDIITSFPTDQIERLREEMPDELSIFPFSGLYYYVFNNNLKPLDDARVRQALSMAVNREVIADRILGTGEIPAYSWVPPGMANYGEPEHVVWQSMSYKQRLEEAKKLLADAGYGPDNPLKFILRYNTNENHKRIAVAIGAMWRILGVDIELFNTEVKVHYDDLNNNEFEIARAGWLTDYNDAINMLELLNSENLYNYGRWENAEFDALIERSEQQSNDLAARSVTLHRAERIALDDTAAMPIYYYVSRNIVSLRVDGFINNARDIHRTRFLNMR